MLNNFINAVNETVDACESSKDWKGTQSTLWQLYSLIFHSVALRSFFLNKIRVGKQKYRENPECQTFLIYLRLYKFNLKNANTCLVQRQLVDYVRSAATLQFVREHSSLVYTVIGN